MPLSNTKYTQYFLFCLHSLPEKMSTCYLKKYFMGMAVFHACICVCYVHSMLMDARKGLSIFVTRVTDGFGPSDRCWIFVKAANVINCEPAICPQHTHFFDQTSCLIFLQRIFLISLTPYASHLLSSEGWWLAYWFKII